jgi:glycerol-3-phosphate dehydrogenase
MKLRNLTFVVLSMLAGPAVAAEIALATPTGEVVACTDVAAVRMTDMPRLFGIDNFHQAHVAFVRFRTFAPRDCAGYAQGQRLAQLGESGARVMLAERAE